MAVCWKKAILLLAFRLCCFTLCRLDCLCSFPVWCLGQDVKFDYTGSRSLPFHLLGIIASLLLFLPVIVSCLLLLVFLHSFSSVFVLFSLSGFFLPSSFHFLYPISCIPFSTSFSHPPPMPCVHLRFPDLLSLILCFPLLTPHSFIATIPVPFPNVHVVVLGKHLL